MGSPSIGPLDKATTSIVGVGRRSHLPVDSATGQLRPRSAPTGCSLASLARFEAGVSEHPAQVDDQLPVDILVVWRLEDLGLAAELDLDLAVGLLSCRSDCVQKRQHLAPLDVAAQRVAEDLLERDAMVVVEVRCHEASPSGLRRHRLPAWVRPTKVAGPVT